MQRDSGFQYGIGPSGSSDGSMEQARDMLIGALDRVIQLATNRDPQGASGSSQIRSQTTVSANTPEPAARRPTNTTIEEHRRLFGYRRATPHNFVPHKAANVTSRQTASQCDRGKGKRGRLMVSAGRAVRSTWKKSCICLKSTHQECKPSAVERIELAKIGLGLAELSFDHDGDAEHIHSVLVNQFPQLETCGGYTLLRLNDNSHDLIEIEHPAKVGMTVPYLKDILNQANWELYIRPLQRSISIDPQQV